MSTLSAEQIHFFQKNGYLKIGKLLEDDHIATLQQEYDREFALARENNRFRNLAISDTEHLEEKNNAPTQMLQIMQMCERNMHFRKLTYHDPILDMVERLKDQGYNYFCKIHRRGCSLLNYSDGDFS